MTDLIEKKRNDLYLTFESCTISELEAMLKESETHEERAFFRKLINIKLQLSQQSIIGEELV